MKSFPRLKRSRFVFLLSLSVVVAACSSGSKGSSPADLGSGSTSTASVPIGRLPAIDMDSLLQHTKVLSSDEYEGRAPGTKGETLTVAYLTQQFEKAGRRPGNAGGTHGQKGCLRR